MIFGSGPLPRFIFVRTIPLLSAALCIGAVRLGERSKLASRGLSLQATWNHDRWQGIPTDPAHPVLHFHLSENQPCECISSGLPLKEGDDGKPYIEYKRGKGESKETLKFPAKYGEECKAWEEEADPKCKEEYPPAYCFEKWCYVDKRCKVKDVKKSLLFQEHGELYFSYANCGSLDAYTAMACMEKEHEGKCKEPCAWNGEHGCQNKLCKCTGDNSHFSKQDLSFYGKDYGTMCSAWDEGSCDQWSSKAKLGLWCCKSWCYVDEACPSAKKSSVKQSLFYSYHACPDDLEALQQCPHKDPVDFEGNPVPLSPTASETLSRSLALSLFRHDGHLPVGAFASALLIATLVRLVGT